MECMAPEAAPSTHRIGQHVICLVLPNLSMEGPSGTQSGLRDVTTDGEYSRLKVDHVAP